MGKMIGFWGVLCLSLFSIQAHAFIFPVAPHTAITQPPTTPIFTRVHFELIDNRIFVNAMINGKGPYKLMFDSGASFAVSKILSDELGLKLGDPFPIGGVGQNQQQAWWTTVDTFQLGKLRMQNQQFLVTSLDPVKNAIGFKQWDGLIGFEVLNQFISRIEYDSKNLTLISPELFHDPGHGVSVPISLYQESTPLFEGAVDGLSGKFAIDTGDRSSLTLMRPFINQNDLNRKYAPAIEAMTGWGIGGPVPAALTRIHSMEFGESESVNEVVTRFPTLPGGFFDAKDLAGSIGGGILKHFNVTFDYPGHRMILERNKNYNSPDLYDRSGMWLVQSGKFFQVHSVIANGPAEQAGIQPGDVIVKINGRPTPSLFLPSVRERLKNPKLNLLTLTIARDNAQRLIFSLRLRNLL